MTLFPTRNLNQSECLIRYLTWTELYIKFSKSNYVQFIKDFCYSTIVNEFSLATVQSSHNTVSTMVLDTLLFHYVRLLAPNWSEATTTRLSTVVVWSLLCLVEELHGVLDEDGGALGMRLLQRNFDGLRPHALLLATPQLQHQQLSATDVLCNTGILLVILLLLLILVAN